MKKFVALSLFLFTVSNFAYSEICFKKDICVKEPKKGLFVVKINTKKRTVKPYAVENGLETSEKIYKNNNFLGVLNGGYFDFKSKKTVSYVIIDGKIVLDPMENENLTNNIGLKPNLDLIINRGEFRRLNCDGKIKYDISKHFDTIKPNCQIVDSLQAGPILYPEIKSEEEYFVKKDATGKITRNAIMTESKKPRSAVAIKKNNVYFIIATKKYPMTLNDLNKLCKKRRYEKALNLDGGGSTSFTNSFVNIKSDGKYNQRKVKSFLIIE